MLPAVNIFHAQYCTEGFTPVLLVEDNWRFLFMELVYINIFFKFPMWAVHDMKSKISGNPLLSSFFDGCNNKKSSSPSLFPTHITRFCSFVLAQMNLHQILIFCMLTQISSNPPQKIMSHMKMFKIFPLTWLTTYCIHKFLGVTQGRSCSFCLQLTLGFVYCMPE